LSNLLTFLIDPNNSTIPEGFAYEPIVKSLAETLAEQVPKAIIVKAFNTMGQEVFELAPAPLQAHQVLCLWLAMMRRRNKP
jgi:8-hydroxy-5-deazaflavin:NADPH oxidoreductase